MREGDHEIAFLGRSNVGKSSLINVLCHKKDLSRTSKMPGRTRHAVVYELLLSNDLEKRSFSLVDLPGFGFANMSKVEAKQCENLIFSYIQERTALTHIFLLLDIRRQPDRREQNIIDIAKERGIDLTIVLTKSDKISQSKRKPALKKAQEHLGLEPSSLIYHSTHDEKLTHALLKHIFEQAKSI